MNEQHLFLDLGEKRGDSVFTRTFSMLAIASVIRAHRRHPFLPENELAVVKRKVLRYIDGEKDYRGFVPEKGWAHAAAHAADTLGQLVQCREIMNGDLIGLLSAINQLIRNHSAVYQFEEDERLVSAVLNAWQRDDSDDINIEHWLESLIPTEDEKLPLPEGYRRFVNTKQFMRSLYFRTKRMPLTQSIHTKIREILTKFNRFV